MIIFFVLVTASIPCGHNFTYMKKRKNSIVRGAASLGAGAFIAKLLGALYRMPLTNLLGGFGLGLYQMVFPVYALLLDFSGAGVPSALSKIISSVNEKDRLNNARNYLTASVKLLSIFGVIGALLMGALSKPLAILQGNPDAFSAYVALAPAIFFVSLISCYRGYFQGLMRMNPTALSQITEQIIKLCFGLIFARLFLPNVPLAVAGATFAITLSEIVAFIQLYITFNVHKRKEKQVFIFDNSLFKPLAKTIIKNTVPITLIGIILPLSNVIDSFLVVNVLSAYRTDAVSLYGILSGVVTTVINLPVSICYGVATSAIPAVAAETDSINQRTAIKKAITLTLIFALPCTAVMAVASPLIIKILFGGLSAEEAFTAQRLLTFLSVNVTLLSLLQTLNAVLIGCGKLLSPIKSLGIGVLVKTALNLILLKIPEINIYGGAVAVIACYFTACLINLFMIFKMKVKNADKRIVNREYAS